METDNYKDYDPIDDCWHKPATDVPEQDEPLLLICKEGGTYSVHVSSRIKTYLNGYTLWPKSKAEWDAADCYDRDNKYLCDWLDVAAWAYLDEIMPAKIAKQVRRDHRWS